MLIEFRVANHRSIKDEQVLSFEAAPRFGNDPRPRSVAGHKKPLLPVAAIYGANASGKSNLLHAMDFMVNMVRTFGFRQRLQPTLFDEPMFQREPHAWGENPNSPSLYSCRFLIDGKSYEYGFVIDDQQILEEWLQSATSRKPLFSRKKEQFLFSEEIGRQPSKTLRKVTRDDSLFMSIAAIHRFPPLQPFVDFLTRRWFLQFSKPATNLEFLINRYARELIAESPSDGSTVLKGELLSLLRLSDLGIVDLRVNKLPVPGDPRTQRYQIELQHELASQSNCWLPLESESRGTQRVFEIAKEIIETLRTGGILVIDELESSLHPLLAMKIVQLFNSPETNPRNAQLVFSTHDSNLLGTTLGEPVLRRDEVWFTEKNQDGATELYPLTDFKPRNVENLERGYLQGRYGAIPFLGELDFSTEVPSP
jgi:AAA15 family ATPase/GTPase